MNRIINFRVWDKKGKYMSNPFSLEDAAREGFPRPITDDNGEFDTRAEYIVMQSTGLLDRHGKEIYEGDIVRCTNKHDDVSFNEVKWVTHMGSWCYVNRACKEGEWISALSMFDNGEEVVGNIYENPELLHE